MGETRTEKPGAVPLQEEIPFALVQGQALFAPRDLYIPPDALEVFLEAFEGPLDLLLYLIKRNNLDILDIPIAEITRQYMNYIDLMKDMRLELAAEYLVMAAMLAEIKSRMLLPRPAAAEDENDPRAELIRRLQEYERYKKAAEAIDGLPRLERDFHARWSPNPNPPGHQAAAPGRTARYARLLPGSHGARRDVPASSCLSSSRCRCANACRRILQVIDDEQFMEFGSLFTVEEGRRGVVVTFLAILELIKESLIEMIQSEMYGPIYVKAPHHVNESNTG
jgi:segregation and condensation protein A